MTKTYGLFDYIGIDVNTLIFGGVTAVVFMTVAYGIYKTYNPSSPESPKDKGGSVDVGVSTDLVRTSDEMVQKSDQPQLDILGNELKKRISQVRDINEVREIYGDKLVDLYLRTQFGEEINYSSMCLQLEVWKRFSELYVVYGIINEDGTVIPSLLNLNNPSSSSISDTSSQISRSSSTSTDGNASNYSRGSTTLISDNSSQVSSGSMTSRASSPDLKLFRKLDIDLRKSLYLPSDIASSDEGGYSDTSSENSLPTTPTTPTIPTSSVESGVDSY